MEGQDKFPILCETCLGENPFIRMTKEPYGKACKICDRPFTVFRWRPGPRARFKKTEICQTCSKMKNVCQTCVLDLQFGLPVQVRDQALDEGDRIEVPQSTVNRDYQAEQYEKQVNDAIAAGENAEPGLLSYGKAQNNKLLSRLARRTPYYQRNRPHICSFYVKGQCTRGEECPFRHETPITGELANQNIKDRFYGVNDPVANKMMREHGERIQKEIEEGVGDANAYTRDNSRHFARLAAAAGSTSGGGPPRVDRRTGPSAPPENKAIVSLFVGGVDSRFTEDELKELFSPYGKIASVNMKPEKGFAFVEYKERSDAETAVKATWNSLSLHGQKLRVDWSKAAPRPKPQPSAPSKQPMYAPPPGMKSAMQFRPPSQPFQPPPPSGAPASSSSPSSTSSSSRTAPSMGQGVAHADPTRHLSFPPPPERPRPPPQAFARMAPPPGAPGGKSLGGSRMYASMNPNSYSASFDDEDARRDR